MVAVGNSIPTTRRLGAGGVKIFSASLLHLLLHFDSNTLQSIPANSESGEFGNSFIANKSFQRPIAPGLSFKPR